MTERAKGGLWSRFLENDIAYSFVTSPTAMIAAAITKRGCGLMRVCAMIIDRTSLD